MNWAAILAAVSLDLPAEAPRDDVTYRCDDDIAPTATRAVITYSSSGRDVQGLLWRPAQPNGAGVVMLHGAGGLHQDGPVLDPGAMQLASRGYHVLAPSYYDAEAPRDQRSSSTMRRWRRAAADGVAFLETQAGMDKDRSALWGYSLGGLLSGEAVMEGVGQAGLALAAGTAVGEPERDRREVALLLMHARQDPVVAPSSTRAWAANLGRRRASVEVQQLDWEGHFFDGPTWCLIFNHTRGFLDRNLAGGRPAKEPQ